MNYRRVLLIAEIEDDPGPAMAAIGRVAPDAEHLVIVARLPARAFAWLSSQAPPEFNDAAETALDRLREAARRAAHAVDVEPTPEFTVDGLAEIVAKSAIDLVVANMPPLRTVPILAELRKRMSVPVLWAGAAPDTVSDHTGTRLLCVGLSARGRAAVMTFLRDHAGPFDRVALLSTRLPSPEDLRELREVSGVSADVELAQGAGSLPELLDRRARQSIDLVVLPHFPPALVIGMTSKPVLVLPPVRPATPEWERAIDVPDLVDNGAVIRVRLEYAIGAGRRQPIADQEVGFVSEGQVVARATSRYGEVELPAGSMGGSLGLYRAQHQNAADPLVSVELSVAVLRPGPRALLLFDAELDDAALSSIRSVAWAEPVGVRVRSMRSCRSLRAKLRRARLSPRVIDAGAVLGEGEAPDVPAQVDAVRLARAAARMRADGFPIAAIVYRGPHQPSTTGFPALRADEIAALAAPPLSVASPTSVSTRLDMTTASETISGNRIEVELDNEKARGWLLSSIDASRQRVHLQVYMALDDDVGRPVEAALAAAGARGVTVRVLVDSLHGLHGSLGAHNPILDRLSSRPGVELRVSKPITGPASLEDLKQRDHRKLVVVDGNVALLGGRNLSHEYYTGFGEVHLTPDTTWRVVPWLDAGARVEGPAVPALERSFLQAWHDAGGAAFDIREAAPVGTTAARVVVHRGLRDANTLEAYLALIETARSHVYAVNGFPLLLEIQHALLRALKRGVRVRTLFGNLTPRHGDTPFGGPWAAARTAATSLVHSRMDALIAAGGDCYEFVVPRQPGWDPAVGDVRPHVHAKTMSADGRVCAVGSANLDVTAGYWESELLLVVEDEAIARGVEARFDDLMAGSARIDSNDPEWRRRAEQRGWMRYWPGMLSG